MADSTSKLWVQKSLAKNAIRTAAEVIQRTGRALPCKVVAVNGAIVTVSFQINSSPWTLPQITIPKHESPWMRDPTQVGDLGMTMPSDVYLGGISGLGGGTATMNPVPNLTALVFVPVSNSNSPPIDPNAAQVQGPNGAIIRTTSGTTSQIVTDTSGTTITYGNTTIVVNASGVTINTTEATVNASTSTTIISPETTISGNLTVGGAISGAGGLTITGGSGASVTGNINTTGSITAAGDIKAGAISLTSHPHSGVQSGSDNSGPPV